MSQEVERTSLWIAVVTMALGIITSVVLVALNAGQMQARVANLEQISQQSVRKDEWTQFTQEMRDRLDRIEKKLDKQESVDNAKR